MTATKWVWRCVGCNHSDHTHMRQLSKTRAVGRCYWCGRGVPFVRVEIDKAQADAEQASRPTAQEEGETR